MAIEIAPPKPLPDRALPDRALPDRDLPEQGLPDTHKRRRDSRALWRLCCWGGLAAIALAALAFTTQTESGSRRLQLAFGAANQPARAIAMADVTLRALEKDAETQRLEAQVRLLAADRDRLTARLASLEHNLEDVTDSIKRQAAQEAAAATAKSPAQAPSAPSTTQQVDSTTPAPGMPAASSAPPAIAPLAMPARTDSPAPWPGTPPAQAATPAPVPLPPTRVAVAPASEPAAEPPRKPEFGVDLGGAPNMDVLSARWAAVKANFGPLLTGLHPVAAHVRRPGTADYRLVVGPLPNAAAATQLCARFAAARVTCRPAKFDGERIEQR
jgi:hypothetical protein